LQDLNSVIIAAKKLYYNTLLLNSKNKQKTAWNIIRTVTNNKNNANHASVMNVKDNLTTNHLTIANAFNK
jgi:hypothetical protein